jgi:NADPH-dependent curcumin reductase CurA
MANRYFFGVSDAIFDSLMLQINPFSCIAICGSISEGFEECLHSINPRSIIAHSMLVQGFMVSDYVSR